MTNSRQILEKKLVEFGVRDPSKLTILQLKSSLTEANIEIPQSIEKKSYYVQLFLETLKNNNKKHVSKNEDEHDRYQKSISNEFQLNHEKNKNDKHSKSKINEIMQVKETKSSLTNTHKNPFRDLIDDAQSAQNNDSKIILPSKFNVNEGYSSSEECSSKSEEDSSLSLTPKPKKLVRKRNDPFSSNKRPKYENEYHNSNEISKNKEYSSIKEQSARPSELWSKKSNNLRDNPFQRPSTIANGNQITSTIIADRFNDSKNNLRKNEEYSVRDSKSNLKYQSENLLNHQISRTNTVHHNENYFKENKIMKEKNKYPNKFVSPSLLKDESLVLPKQKPPSIEAIFLPKRIEHPSKLATESNAAQISSVKYVVMIILILIFIIASGSIIYQMKKFNTTSIKVNESPLPQFCDTERPKLVSENCIPCPEYGLCSEGKLIACELGFIIRDNLCIEDEEIINEAYQFIEYLKPILSLNRGMYECGQVEKYYNYTSLYSSYTLRGISLIEIKSILQKEYISGRGIRLADRFETVYLKFRNIVDTINVGLKIEPIIEENEINSMDEKLFMLTSEITTKPFKCIVNEIYLKNRWYIYVTIAFISILSLFLIYLQRLQSEKEMREKIFGIVLTELRKSTENGGVCVIVHLRDELKEKYNINDSTWNKIKNRINSDSRVEEWINEQNNEVWIWKSGQTKKDD